tara:strand:+ start:616 stop:780 length:165 start_codon:yes stop_codon:yes gene_type:complete
MSHFTLSLPNADAAKRAEQIAKQQYQRFLSNWAQQLFYLKAQEKESIINVKKAA